MPAKKTGRQQVKRARRNRSAKTETRTLVGRANRSLEAGDAEGRAARSGLGHSHTGPRSAEGYSAQEQCSPPQV